MLEDRWGLYIDIEGFGRKYDQTMEALIPLNALMEGIYKIGSVMYTGTADRLFAHQFGDGFIIVSSHHEESLDRPLAIAISLMRHVLSAGGIAKASLSEGGFSDIKGCYPKLVTDNEKSGRVHLGHGLMTIIPVMGTALINAVHLDKLSPSGSLLTISKDNLGRVLDSFSHRKIENDLVSINWLRGEHQIVDQISQVSGLMNPEENKRLDLLDKYVANNKLRSDWVRTTYYEQVILG